MTDWGNDDGTRRSQPLVSLATSRRATSTDPDGSGARRVARHHDDPCRAPSGDGRGRHARRNQETPMSLRRSPAQWCASFLLVVAAGTHIPLIREHLEEAPYVGWLFLALSVVCLGLAVAILVVDTPGVWMLSGAVCLAAVVAFLASRTVGLPQIGDDVGNWTEPL